MLSFEKERGEEEGCYKKDALMARACCHWWSSLLFRKLQSRCVTSCCDKSACVSNSQGRAEKKTRATVMCTALWSVRVCVRALDNAGVAHSTGHVCGKHCMHTRGRWKGRGRRAGSEEQKKRHHVISQIGADLADHMKGRATLKKKGFCTRGCQGRHRDW